VADQDFTNQNVEALGSACFYTSSGFVFTGAMSVIPGFTPKQGMQLPHRMLKSVTVDLLF
jgi:hypothetical protein